MGVMNATNSEKQILLDTYKNEKNADVVKRIHLIIGVRVDEKIIIMTAKDLYMSRTWGLKWHSRYKKEGLKGLCNRPKTGRPPSVH